MVNIFNRRIPEDTVLEAFEKAAKMDCAYCFSLDRCEENDMLRCDTCSSTFYKRDVIAALKNHSTNNLYQEAFDYLVDVLDSWCRD